MTINNISNYATNPEIKAIVYRSIDGENWFYGAYQSKEKAYEVYKYLVSQNQETGIKYL